MKIDDIIQGFNMTLDRLRGNKDNNTFLVIATNISKKIGDIKEFIISIYLVNKSTSKNQLIMKSTHARKCLIQDTQKVAEELFIDMIPDLILLFTVYGKDLAFGTYESPFEENGIISPLPDPK